MRVVKWVAGVMVVLLVVGGGAAWWQRESLNAWWVVRGLKQAGEGDRETWVNRVSELGEPAVGPLVECLIGADDRGRDNVLAALDSLIRLGCAAEQLVQPFPKLPAPARAEVLRMLIWPKDEDTRSASGKILIEAAGDAEPEVQSSAVDLAAALIANPIGPEKVVPAVRETARAGLRSASAEVRLKAVRLCLQPGVDMLEHVVALLRDPTPEVRRAAILAVGPADQVVRDDVLLLGLHDADEEVRKLTEVALTGRGLRPEHLDLGRLLTHPAPAERLQVLDRIRDMLNDGQSELDPGAWLRRLSHDQSPAVRAAALRMMTQQSVVDLSDRVDQMARGDPSPTVTQLARYYQGRKR